MAAASLPRPGVQVIQQFRAQSPTVITPQLVPCIVGVCKQIVELLVSDGAGGQVLNPDALIQLPAFFTSKDAVGTPPVFTGLDGLRLSVSINNSPAVQVTFSDPSASGLTPATVADQINTAFGALNVSSALAVVLDAGTSDDTQFKLQTVGLGQFQSIYIDPALTDDVVADTFGIGKGQTYYGLADYNNLQVTIPQESFPDPRGNLSELAFDLSSLRVFLSTGSGIGVFEAKRTESFLRSGEVNDVATFTSTLQTVPAITYPNNFWGKTVILTVDGVQQTYTFPTNSAAPASADALAAMLTAGFEGLTVVHDTGDLDWTLDSEGYSSHLQVGAGTANTLLGLVGNEDIRGLSIAAVDDGNGDATTSLIEFDAEDFQLGAQQGVLDGATTINYSLISAGSTLILSDGQQPQEVVFDGTETTISDLFDKIDPIVGLGAGGRIVFGETGVGTGIARFTNSPLFGDESLIRIIGGTALPAFDQGTTPAQTPVGTQSFGPDTNAVVGPGTVNAVDTAGIWPLPSGGSAIAFDINGDTYTSAGEANFADFKAALEAAITDPITVTRVGGTEGGVVITSNDPVPGSADTLILVEGANNGLAYFGLTAGTYAGTDVFPTLGTETFTVTADEDALTPPAAVQVAFASETDFATVKVNVDAQLVALSVTIEQDAVTGGVYFLGTTTGRTGSIRLSVDVPGGGMALLGLNEGVWYGSGENIYAGAEARGRAHPPLPGDDIYIDGAFYATVNQVAPGGNANQLKIDRQVAIDADVGARWFIQAKQLTGPNSTSRPSADLQVTLSGEALVKHTLMRDFAGNPVNTRAPLYLAYDAVRKDTTALAEDPGLLRFYDTVQLEEALAPISASNPLALGIYFALINAPGVQVTGLGIDAITADSPDGTVEAFTRAVEYLEGFEVYGIAPLTHDETVAQVFNTHVNFMSEPEQRGERIVMWNPSTPTRALDTLVGSGTNGDALNTFTFDTKIVNLSALVQNAGVSPVGTIPVTEGLFLDIAADDKRYSIKSISGSQVTVRIAAAEFTLGSNDDDFYAESALPLPLIGELFSVRIRGAALVTIDGKPDRNAVAETVNALGVSFGNRRFWMTFPSKCRATIEGFEQLIEGYFLNAATVGAIAQQPPQQSFTNFPIAGFTAVVGSNDSFSEAQLDTMAGGGAYIFIQEGRGTPVFARMALTTDLTSIETRTDSVNKVVDFTAKFLRASLRNFIGRFNITQGFLDTLGTTVQGLFGFLVETGVLIGGQLDNIIQDEDARDTVLIDTTLDVPIPCNYIKLTLLI